MKKSHRGKSILAAVFIFGLLALGARVDLVKDLYSAFQSSPVVQSLGNVFNSDADDIEKNISENVPKESESDSGPGVPSDTGGSSKLTDERALEVLARFNEKMAKVSKEDYQEGEQRVQRFLNKAQVLEKAKPEPPKESLFVDENGHQWTKLEFGSGEVRYEFPK